MDGIEILKHDWMFRLVGEGKGFIFYILKFNVSQKDKKAELEFTNPRGQITEAILYLFETRTPL